MYACAIITKWHGTGFKTPARSQISSLGTIERYGFSQSALLHSTVYCSHHYSAMPAHHHCQNSNLTLPACSACQSHCKYAKLLPNGITCIQTRYRKVMAHFVLKRSKHWVALRKLPSQSLPCLQQGPQLSWISTAVLT